METRKSTLGSLKVCRFCLSTEETLMPLYDKVRAPKNSVPFALKILACIAIEIFPSDNMPQYICQRCKLFMEISYAFKQLCRQADEAILQYIQMGTPLNPMSWPTQLNKVYKAHYKSAEANVVKTVVQGGATVKVMTEEISDSEEGDDDNVYNVKIDGADQTKSIKVITSVHDKPEQTGSKRSRQSNPETLTSNTADSEEADNGEEKSVEPGCWACDQCECTYPLKQLLVLHQAQKHRKRSETCEECGGKFFSKYDLMMHQVTHSPDMPFQCVACGKKFKRLILLKRHEKDMHYDLPQQVCLHCPATYLSIEELEAHQQIHNNKVRPFVCHICHKKFHEKSLLQRHIATVHNKKPAFSCQYCPEQFASVMKLTRHVREHAGERPYPCKHCDKSFTKSHHYTRHLRLKHSETTRTPGPYNESDAYRCDECEETFSTQDDLMYHSALHATTNLTCPLCQEKFEDVDTVTAHIKSHVNGAEHMCDFCELIFTSKEKLEIHIAQSHDDELLANDQEIEPDESSMDMDAEEEDDDNSIKVKEEDDHMVVEIKNSDEYMLPIPNQTYEEDKADNTQSEDSDVTNQDSPPSEMEVMPTPTRQVIMAHKNAIIRKVPEIAPKEAQHVKTKLMENHGKIHQTNILRKADEIKRKAIALQQQQVRSVTVADKKVKLEKVESTTTLGASDKSLRLLEKELQDLKRTNTRVEAAKPPSRSVESLRNRRLQLYSSTPKMRPVEKKETITAKPALEKTIPDKRQSERKPTKDPKEFKSNNNTIKEDKEIDIKEDKSDMNEKEVAKEDRKEKEKEIVKEDNKEKEKQVVKEEKKEKVKEIVKEEKKEREKEILKEDKKKKEKEVIKEDKNGKEKEISKLAKSGASETTAPAVEEAVRRSSRPSKFKDYAKMIRDSSMNSDDNESEEDDSEEYIEQEKTPEMPRARGRRSSVKQAPAQTPVKPVTSATAVKPIASTTAAKPVTPTAIVKLITPATPVTPATAPRKRGRPRKDTAQTAVPSKIKKDGPSEGETDAEPPKEDVPPQRISPPKEDTPKETESETVTEGIKTPPEANKVSSEPKPSVIMSPSGQTLKKVPMKALPPGVKPLPLPVNSRLTGGEVCEMQIGKKMVKVQKIVMTKAEVEAMAKKGLVEMKDGTMVLKQGIKLPSADPAALKSTLVGDSEHKKESPAKVEKAAPTRCDLDA